MIQILLYVFIGILFTVIDLWCIQQQTIKRFGKWLVAFAFYTAVINLTVICGLLLILHKPNALLSKLYHTFFALEYFAAACLVGCLLCLIQLFVTKRLHFTYATTNHKWYSLVTNLCIMSFGFLGLLLIFFTDWWTYFLSPVKPSQITSKVQILAHFNRYETVHAMIFGPFIKTCFYVLPLIVFMYFNRFNINWQGRTKNFILIKRKWIQMGLLAFTLALFISGAWYLCYELHLIQLLTKTH